MSRTRAERLEALEHWAERVKPEDLKEADPPVVQQILSAVEDRQQDTEQHTTIERNSA